ncbi:hypothetical protein [Nonomuraea insulae]|uniref:Uncharacterized protein n=1 Tax=Nonomuraea insulae TaxID=1616787 RepID=A0ABW1CUX4_9ACTN
MNFKPDFSGVKQPEFDTMTARHTAAAEQLANLSSSLQAELSKAGLDTATASRIRDLATRADRRAADLRRRQGLARELERQKVVFGTRTTAGTFLVLPDKLADVQHMLDGTLAADAALAASRGGTDEKSMRARLEQLRKHARDADDPEFALAFLRRLGPKGLTTFPNTLRRALEHASPEQRERLKELGEQALRMMSTALAVGTNPKSPGYVGDDYLEKLKAAGRDEPESGGKASGMPTGYHALSAILAQHPGKPRYSAKFMEIVGRDMINLDRDIWAKGKNTVVRSMPSFLPGLLHAAASSRTAAQTLLYHMPAGATNTNLNYLLHDRRELWSSAPNGINVPYHAGAKSFGETLKAAMSGNDTVSKRLLAETIKIFGKDMPTFFKRNDQERLELTDKQALDALAGLRRPLGDVFSAHIDQLGKVYDAQVALRTNVGADPRDKTVNSGDLDWAMLFVAGDDTAFRKVIRTQAEHMRVEIDSIFPLKKHGQRMLDPISRESNTFGHLIGAREEALYSAGRGAEAAAKELQEMVKSAIGMIPVPGQAVVGQLAANAFKGMRLEEFAKTLLDKTGDHSTEYIFDKAGDWVTDEFSGRSVDEAYQAAKDSQDLGAQLVNQMIASAVIAHGLHDRSSLQNRSFVENGRIKPLLEMTPKEYQSFVNWAAEHSGLSGDTFSARGVMNDGAEAARDTYGLANSERGQ